MSCGVHRAQLLAAVRLALGWLVMLAYSQGDLRHMIVMYDLVIAAVALIIVMNGWPLLLAFRFEQALKHKVRSSRRYCGAHLVFSTRR